MASARVREVYEVATGAGSCALSYYLHVMVDFDPAWTAAAKKKAKAKEEPAPAKKPKKVFEDGDDCPVCYEALKDANESDLTFCEACSNALHKECFNQCEEKPYTRVLTQYNDSFRASYQGRGRTHLCLVSITMGRTPSEGGRIWLEIGRRPSLR